VASCPFGAVKYGEKIKLRLRKVDLENIEKLKGMEGITVLEHPRQIEAIIKRL
jgi:flavoprotein